jgi:hypothetical protein
MAAQTSAHPKTQFVLPEAELRMLVAWHCDHKLSAEATTRTVKTSETPSPSVPMPQISKQKVERR